MADKPKMSVEEMLAAARAEKGGAPKPPKPAETAQEPAPTAPESAPVAQSDDAPQAKPAAKPAKGRSPVRGKAAPRKSKR